MADDAPEARFPMLNEAGARMLRWLTEHPAAPLFTHLATERLSGLALARLAAWEKGLDSMPTQADSWLEDLIKRCYRLVPHYRALGAPPEALSAVPSIHRGDLAAVPWRFVPDDAPLDDTMAVYQTSGTTGHPINVPTDAVALAKYVPLLRRALALHGLRLSGGPDTVAIAVVAFQASTWTWASVAQYLGMAGCVKLNLNPADWRRPEDRAAFLEACAPELICGDPISFAEMARLRVNVRPTALISTAMTLLPFVRDDLMTRFGCPVIDLYSMNESGPLAARDPGDTWRWLRPDILLELLGPEDQPVADGARGEITLTGGNNPYLPLLRYRTGDFASIRRASDGLALADIEGRPPIVFRTTDGRFVNTVDVSIAMKAHALAQFTLRQRQDGGLILRVRGRRDPAGLSATLAGLFGSSTETVIEDLPDGPPETKCVQYTCDAS
jgi:phenylacetate-CoA ligase